MIMYQGLDMLMKLLTGQGGVSINTMYLEFQNGGTPPVITPDPADGRTYYAALESGLTAADYLRIPFSNVPTLSTTDVSKFLANKGTFFAMSTGQTVGRGGKPFSAGDGSIVYGIALVCAADVADASQDIVFSRTYNFTAISKEVGQEISMTWAHILDESMISSS